MAPIISGKRISYRTTPASSGLITSSSPDPSALTEIDQPCMTLSLGLHRAASKRPTMYSLRKPCKKVCYIHGSGSLPVRLPAYTSMYILQPSHQISTASCKTTSPLLKTLRMLQDSPLLKPERIQPEWPNPPARHSTSPPSSEASAP